VRFPARKRASEHRAGGVGAEAALSTGSIASFPAVRKPEGSGFKPENGYEPRYAGSTLAVVDQLDSDAGDATEGEG